MTAVATVAVMTTGAAAIAVAPNAVAPNTPTAALVAAPVPSTVAVTVAVPIPTVPPKAIFVRTELTAGVVVIVVIGTEVAASI